MVLKHVYWQYSYNIKQDYGKPIIKATHKLKHKSVQNLLNLSS